MSRFLRSAAALSMVAFLIGMSGAVGAMAAPTRSPSAQGTLPAEVLQTQWVLEYLSTEAKTAGQDITSSGITLKFAPDGTLEGSGGCNNYFGSYTVSGQQMTISKVGSTQKACEQSVMDRETRYLQQLSAVNAYNDNQSKLELAYTNGANGKNTMTFIPGSGGTGQGGTAGQGGANSLPSDIVNTEWTLQYFTNAAAQDASADHITIIFAPDGTLEGSGGCNNYFGTYTVSGGDLTISDQLGSTQMFCEQAVMTKESLYFRLLLSVNSYQITNGNLQLVYGSSSSTNPNMLTYISTAASARPGASQLPAQVLGTAWTLKYLDSNNTSGQDVSASGRMIKFEPDGTFYGSTGCNDFFGTYTVSGEKLTIGNVATTRKVCPDIDETLDSSFLQHLAAAKTYILANNGELSLDYQDTGSSLVFVRTTRVLAVHVQPVVVVGMPTTGSGTPMPVLLLLAGSLVLLAAGVGLRKQVAWKAVRK